MTEYKLLLDDISKSFGATRANDRVTLAVRPGSVHAILGENGAGKSTLMNILYGLYRPDSGRILVDGREVEIHSPRDALDAGIGMVHQHFMLVTQLSVVENIVLGMKRLGLQLNLAAHSRALEELSQSFGFDIDPWAEVGKLSVGMQQRVEILKLLYHEADILILDEPTSVLTPGEIGPFFDLLRRLRDAGRTIILITHKLDEVMAIADRVTVMQDGKVKSELSTEEADTDMLAHLMVGREVMVRVRHPNRSPGATMLRLEKISVADARGLPALDVVSIDLRAGEVLGIAGVDGNGQAELARVIAGLVPAQSGRLLLEGVDITGAGVAERLQRFGIAYVPEDRHRDGLVLDASVAQNAVLRRYRSPPFARMGFFRPAMIRDHAQRLADSYSVRMQSVDQPIRFLSGGNQQKVILARELDGEPRVLVVAQPTKGLDVGAIEFVQSEIIAQRDRGVAVLYISTELEHLLDVADRVGVLYRGHLMDVLPAEDASAERVGLLMAGVAPQRAGAA
ncbi:MAG: heme ABC transporter ATP-binding protein [Alphaproteobacteria bacterium HGW-Alphaproteobacteria-2]|nr:MAG: heme ABC transporter ATP-binding protein [Alphaproteobacteria bacterium HGW-Alphaproteobacteria-2]